MAKKKARAAASRKKTPGTDVRGFISNTAADVINEVERASDVVMREIRDSFDYLGNKATETAHYATATTKAVRDRVTSKETVDRLHGLLEDIEEAGEGLLKVIGSSFETLKGTVISGSGAGGTRKAARKKTTARKKTSAKKAAAKKTAQRRKAPVRKRAAAKKAVTRRKAPARKKTAARKTATRRKAPARKKTTRKTAR
jgi:hypothetical protein